MILRQSYHLFVALLALPSAIRAQSLAFTNPEANALSSLTGYLNYSADESVNVRWTTAYKFTTLRLWQGPLADGRTVSRVLAANYTSDQTSYTWAARRADDLPLSRPFHFQLQNGEDGTCGDCSLDSVTFYVNRAESSMTSMSSTSPATSGSALSAIATLPSSSTSGIIAGAAMTAQSESTSSPDSRNERRSPDLVLPLGVGLGVGTPVLFALLALLALLCVVRRRRKRRKAENLPRGRQTVNISADGPVHASSLDRSLNQSTDRHPILQQHLQEPLPPYFTPPMYMRGSTSHSRNSAASQNSYFEPFEFERPGTRDFETRSVMSEMTGHARNNTTGAGLTSIDEDPGPAGSRGMAQGPFFVPGTPTEPDMGPPSPSARDSAGTPEWPLTSNRLQTPRRSRIDPW